MYPRAQRDAIRRHLNTARQALDAGDRARAQLEVEAALALDPEYLAARALLEQIAHGAAAPFPVAPPPRVVEPPPVPEQGWIRFEARARARRIDKRADAARAAIARGHLDRARDAMAEIRDIDPTHPELISLKFELDAAHHAPRPGSVWRRLTGGAALCALGTALLLWPATRAQRSVDKPAPAAADPAPVVADSPAVDTAALPTDVALAPEPGADVRATTGRDGAREDGTAVAGGDGEPISHDAPTPPPSANQPPEASLDTQGSVRAASADAASRFDARGGPQLDMRAYRRGAAVEPAAAVAEESGATVPEPRPQLPAPEPQPVSRATPLSTPAFAPPAAPAAVPEAPPHPAPALPPVAVPIVRDDELARRALQQYRRGYDALDARAVQQVWPAVDTSALQRAFDGLQSQRLTFEDCQIDLRGAAATAVCRGTARYVPKVGSRDPREDARVWTFNLRKNADAWVIASARADR
ncbi:MAG: hypothetical protein U0Q55_20565 [Vicinamibacterales bacterium]